MAAPLVSLSNVSKIFQTRTIQTWAVREVNLDIAAAEFVSIAGASGSGKSTLLSLLGLIDLPSSGEYWLSGVATHSLTRGQLAKIRNRYVGWIFQDFHLITELTVAENVALPLKYSTSIPQSEIQSRVTDVLESVEMSHRAGHYPGQLSGGQQQRVAIARGLVTDPAFVLADEPTGNLDSRSGEMILNLICEIHQTRSCTVALVTHDKQAAALAPRQLMMIDGKVHES